MASKNNARIPDIEALIAAGIDPKTGLPLKARMGSLAGVQAIIRVQDEQDAVNRFKWYNFPGLSSQEVERMLYYRGQLAFFNFEAIKSYYLLPFSLSGTVDIYGRFNTIKPLPFGATNESKDREEVRGRAKNIADLLADLKLTVVKEVMLEEEAAEFKNTGAVILYDYTPQISRTILSRWTLNDALILLEAKCLPYMRTALKNATGVRGLRVGAEDELAKAKAMSQQLENAAIEGDTYVPVTGAIDFQDLAGEAVGKSEDFLLAMQALDNIRLGTHGIENGGIFQKKAHELQSENDMNTTSRRSAMLDALGNRRRFCDIVNSIWGLGIWCDVNEDAKEWQEEPEETDENEPDVGEMEEKDDGFGNA